MIKIKNLVKRYNDIYAIKNINLELATSYDPNIPELNQSY